MRKASCATVIVGLFFLVVLGVSYGVTDSAAQAKAGESVITYDDPAMAKEGPVEFSHPKHKEAYGEAKLDCKPCHMSKPPLFEMKKRAAGEARPVVKMAEMAKGKACGQCHDGKTTVKGKAVFGVTDEKSCGRCHKKK